MSDRLSPVTALVFYEYTITLGQEIDMFWKRKFTGATVLFLLTRYLLLLYFILDFASIERSSEIVSGCQLLALRSACQDAVC